MIEIKRRLVVGSILLAAVLVLAGCGSGAAGSGGGEGTESAGRLVEHAMGDIEVPENPQKVVVLDTGELDSALALGVKPVGSVTGREGSAFPTYLEGETEGIEDVGTYEQPDLETIAALEPDLILSSKLRHEAIYDQLSQIAPTVFTEEVGVVWKENFMKHAKALNKAGEAERMMDEYYGRAEDLKQRIGDRLEETEVSVVRFLPDEVRLMMKDSFLGTVLEDVGLPRPPAQDKDVFMEEGSKERIPDMDGDAVFVTVFGPSGESVLEEYENDPLWQRLDVVQGGRVYEVSDDVWIRGIGILGANEILDGLEKYLTEK